VAAFVAFLAAWAGSIALAGPRFRRLTMLLDEGGGALRKVHYGATPRIGGIAVAIGIFAGAMVDIAINGRSSPWLLIPCVAPGFAWGLIEDLSKRGAVFARLALTGVVPALAFILFDARLTEIGVPLLDHALAIPALSFIFTVFAVTGVTHSMNVIDGLNGLSGVTALLASLGLAVVAWGVGDLFLATFAFILAASALGFLLVNYPSGHLFLGDGGAYLFGLLLAELSVLLVQRNSEVSPWFPLMLLAYPVWETLFSMYRRRMRGHSTGHADALHLHTLIYRRVVRWRGFDASVEDGATRNSLASLCLWGIPVSCLLVALVFWDNTTVLQGAALGFAALYTVAYWKLVHFGVPGWLVMRSSRSSVDCDELVEDGGPK
jgi:UDP-N-acetylmuramyl pentapeptide phosphotransferase/UDP-N-acetylglucosamine-1-phosphate transferase